MVTEPVARVVGPADLDRVVDILAGAFFEDPVWGWSFPDRSLRHTQLGRVWRVFVESSADYSSAWVNADVTAAALWIPPGQPEFSPERAAELEGLFVELLGADDAPRMVATNEAFEHAHPHDAEHYYLSVLGTDPAHRGRGLGLQLLEDTLALADEDAMPAYLEASNPVNVPLYERYGFRRYGRFPLPLGGPEVITMWRDPQPPA